MYQYLCFLFITVLLCIACDESSNTSSANNMDNDAIMPNDLSMMDMQMMNKDMADDNEIIDMQMDMFTMMDMQVVDMQVEVDALIDMEVDMLILAVW